MVPPGGFLHFSPPPIPVPSGNIRGSFRAAASELPPVPGGCDGGYPVMAGVGLRSRCVSRLGVRLARVLVARRTTTHAISPLLDAVHAY